MTTATLIRNLTAANGEGGTFNADGTIHAATTGYAVAGLNFEFTFETLGTEFLETVEYAIFNIENFDDYAGKLIGTWFDNGKWYLDISEIIHDETEAINAARDRGELAIYDIANNVSIYV